MLTENNKIGLIKHVSTSALNGMQSYCRLKMIQSQLSSVFKYIHQPFVFCPTSYLLTIHLNTLGSAADDP